jgi:transposase InsO family protein
MDQEKKQKIALFRFGVISRLLWVKEEERQREALLREITSMAWEIPFSSRTALGRSTVLEWLKKYRDSGGKIESLEPQQRSDKGKPRSLDEETEQTLVRLKAELKAASLPVILRVARERKLLPPDFHASIQSLYRLFQRRGLNEPQGPKPDLRRYETELPNDLWQSDCMHGPSVIVEGKVRKSFLFAFLDDHSRLIPHGQFYLQENLKNLIDCLVKALCKRGLPRKIYLDNGPSFRSHQLAHATASLGISLIHCTPYRPEGKGKIERFFKTLRMQFLPLLPPSLSLTDLNERFQQWCDQTYHRTVHGTTQETPWDRYTQHLHLLRPAPQNLSDFFRTRARRKVDRDRTVTLNGKIYEAPVELIGKNVHLLYHPDDPQRIEIFYQDQSYGFLVSLNPYINARIKRSSKRTHIEPQLASLSPPPSAKSYQGGKLFERRPDDDSL